MEKINEETGENLKNEDFTEIEIPYNLYQYISSGECNLQSMCRICLSTSNEMMYPLISAKENSLLAIMFTELSSVQLAEDGLPSCICESCQIQVVQCYEFKSKCMKSDCLLRSLLKNEFIAKEEQTNDSVITKDEARIQSVNNNDEEHETDLIEDVQYLEDFSDDAFQNDNLQIENRTKRKKKKAKVSITDSDSLLKEVISAKKYASKKNKTYRCIYCSKKFSKAKTFHAHVKSNHGDTKSAHPCTQCKESFNSEHDLLIHSALHVKGSALKCNICHKEFKGRVPFRRHIKRHMECKRHACDLCGKCFTEIYALRRHLRVHTGQRVEKKHACHMCDKRYSSSALLAAHEARHAGLRPCACAACGKTFPSPRLLASHMLVHSDAKPYACSYCDRRFRHESTRNTHHRTHTGEKPYICSVCGKSFIQNSNLTLHMRTHTGERPYSCSMCERKFTSGSSLKSHERVHTGERPYSCNICGKKFARMNLNLHMRLHTGERPYACTVCPKKFVNASRLRDHCRIHTGEKPFGCAVCTLKCATKAHLVKHMKIHKPKSQKNMVIQNLEPELHTNVIFKPYKEGSAPQSIENNHATNVILNSVPIEVTHEVPLEVTGELVVQDDSNAKTEYLVVDNSQSNNQSDLCVNDNNVNIISDNDLNLVTVNKGEVSISTSNLEGTTVKLYQVDQSLLQIHSSGGQVTISKITSKMTANF